MIIAAQVAARETTATAAYIPTPDASQLIDYYEELYSRRFQLPTNLLKFSRTVEEVCGPSYCMDARDVQWLREFNARLAGGRGSGATASASPRAKGRALASSPSPKNKGKNAMDVDGTNAALVSSPTTSPRKASPRKLDEKTVVPSPKPVDVRASGPPLPLSTSTTWPAEPPLSATSSAIPRPPANQISEEQFESIISILETTTTERQKEVRCTSARSHSFF